MLSDFGWSDLGTWDSLYSIGEKDGNSGDFVWNSGIFVWNVQSIIKAFNQHLYEIAEIFEEGANQLNSPEEESFIANAIPKAGISPSTTG